VKPALSVLFFTVLSGAGLGALALLAIFDLAALAGVGMSATPPAETPIAATFALVAVVVGLCSSTLHLANPRNAWRSATRWRTSWLSREAVVSLALLAAAAAYALAWWLGASPAVRALLALATMLLAWSTLFCTAMIYASLKPIRQWYTWRVPLGYLLLGHATGALLLVAVWRWHGLDAPPLTLAALGLFLLAALAKLEYWQYVRGDAGVRTLADAIGVAHGVGPQSMPDRPVPSVMAARLFDVGHSRGTFLTREFMHTLMPPRRALLQAIVWLAGFALPVVWLAWGLARWQGALLACLACLAGMLAERWLFFADARHTVRLYHGDRHT
jgi:DMSO reductase anchor subunit